MSASGDDGSVARIGDLVAPENMSQVLVQLSITLAIGVLIVGKVFNAMRSQHHRLDRCRQPESKSNS